jgi:uncharacterized membrane protein
MEDFVKALTLHLASATEAAAALVIGLAIVESVIRSLLTFARNSGDPDVGDRNGDRKEEVRLRLGRWLALALEFELAADILRTAVAPTWNEIGQLAAIIVLRTALNYFLQREIETSRARGPMHTPAGAAAEAAD